MTHHRQWESARTSVTDPSQQKGKVVYCTGSTVSRRRRDRQQQKAQEQQENERITKLSSILLQTEATIGTRDFYCI
jgi:hypothetical protein